MAWIETISTDDATGVLKREYDAAIGRAGKVYGIVRAMSLNPPVLASAVRLYKDIMFRQSPLTRTQREMLATAVSIFNGCRY